MWWEPFLNIVSSLGISYSFTMKGNGLYHPEPTAQASHVRYLGSKECSSKVEAAFGSEKICRRKSSSKQQVGRPSRWEPLWLPFPPVLKLTQKVTYHQLQKFLTGLQIQEMTSINWKPLGISKRRLIDRSKAK